MSRFKPVLGIDIDGVLADTDVGWAAYFSRNKCGTIHAASPSKYYWDNWKDLCKECFDKVLHTPECIHSIPVMQDAEDALLRLYSQYRLIVVTSRDPSDAIPTQQWLKWHRLLPYFETVIHFDDKRSILEHYGAVAHIDDAPGKIESLKGSTVQPIIFDAPYNQDVQGKRVRGWMEATEYLLFE